ncbi:hypothetical protein BC628DRAFT_1308266 [Trametes gibbosa]|nr:hypothetical protein BC628DRAFT_1308266 [Trametes gibbosa]
MPRRTATPATPAPPASLPPPPRDIANLAESDPQWADNLRILRQHWKWANFSQFFYTFAPLLAMPDVFLADVEDDLARGTNLYLPRIMHRLLYTLSQDRKINIDNWQTALRRQHLRRSPESNPIGPEPKAPSRESSLALSEVEKDEDEEVPSEPKPAHSVGDAVAIQDNGRAADNSQPDINGDSSEPKLEQHEDSKVPAEDAADKPLKAEVTEESRDWLDLPMLEKLDSLHLITDWQFQNPYKVRQLMKDDDELAEWRIEPIGYDAKTNAYWLIGPDRLWIQRVPPKPPRAGNLKRKRPAAAAKKSGANVSTSKVPESVSDDEDDDVEPVIRSKRTRTRLHTQSASRARTNSRSTRISRRHTRASSPATAELSSPGKSTRAAKVQANKKLDLQAKELAEFQRQTARLAKSHPSPRASRTNAPNPMKRAVGTRISARLRRSTRGAPEEHEDDEDSEWQQVPDEWLQGDPSPSRRGSARARAKGKARAAEPDDEELDEQGPADVEPDVDADDDAAQAQDSNGAMGAGDDDDFARAGDADEIAQEDRHRQKTGLESDGISELTDLSEHEDVSIADADDPHEPSSGKRNTRSRKNIGGRKPARQSRRKPQPRVVKVSSPSKVQTEPERPQPTAEEVHADEPSAPPIPDDFVEWEAIAVTLSEWEHIADRFANATHYLEKALYKVLSQNLVPIVTAELKEHEKRRRIEEAVVHRKRSSRIALKENEKEEARLAAKKRAEEEDKMARAKRQEARLKKEEAERAKRERARDQRRKERDDREARARAKAERAESRADSKEVDTSAARSTATPTINGTRASSSVQPSRVVTPNGVRSPDWILDCEVCHKQGVNVDDGMAMVSCGSCNRWQHIACHDLSDQRSSRPRRNWQTQQFFCSRCRHRATNGGGYGTQPQQSYPPSSHAAYGWSQTGRSVPLHKPGGIDPYAQTSDLRYAHRSAVENGLGFPQQQFNSNHVGAATYSRPSYPNSGVPFSHYQSDQRGMSSSRGGIPSMTSSSSWTNGTSYPSSDHMTGRMQSAHFVPQYAHSGGIYASNRIPSAYQLTPFQSSSTPSHPYTSPHDTTGTMSAARWPGSSSVVNGYHAPTGNAVQTAAESLAFMHDGGGRYGNSSGWSQSSYAHGQSQMLHSSTQSGHSSHSSYPPAPLGVDPLAFPTPRPEQHVGSSLPNNAPFNFTS